MGILNTLVFWAGVIVTLGAGLPVAIQLLRTHPRGLIVLFFAEMWERFSFYGVRGLLVYYLTQHFLFDDKFAADQYGSYTTLVYLMPLIGGFLADRYLGTYKAVAFGAMLLTIGQFAMAIHAGPAKQYLDYTAGAVHARYEVVVPDGRPGVPSKLQVGGKAYEMSSDKGVLTLKGLPATAPIPATMPTSAYKLTSVRDPDFVRIFYIAISFIIMGVAFLKANISTIVGQLYEQGDPRRDPGFTLFYFGINLGAFWAAVICGYFGQNVDWGLGFGLAGGGMLLGLLSFVIFKPALKGKGAPPDPVRLKAPVVGPISREWLIYLFGLAGVAGVFFLVQRNSLVGWSLAGAWVLVLAYIGFMMITKFNGVERMRLLLAFILIFGSVMFWSLYEQAGSTLALFADRNVDLSILSSAARFDVLGNAVALGTPAQLAAAHIDPTKVFWIDTTMAPSQTQTFQPFFLLIFAPIFAGIWSALGRRGKDPGPVNKFGLALVQVGLAFLVLGWGSSMHDASFRMPLALLAGAYLLSETGELCMSPVGLSQITKLSPVVVVSTMMATWFMATSLAEFVGAKIASLVGTATVGGKVLDPAAALNGFVHVFNSAGWASVGVGVAFLVIAPFVRRWAHGANDVKTDEAAAT